MSLFFLAIFTNVDFCKSRDELEKEHVDHRRFTIAAGFATILTKVLQVRLNTTMPTFVAKDKSNIKARLLTGKTRKMTLKGHHLIAHQYFTVTYCNHCQLIIGGIGPQGYQCGGTTLGLLFVAVLWRISIYLFIYLFQFTGCPIIQKQ